jgi:hypothetical protein
MDREILYFDEATYDYFLNKEKELFKTIHKLETLVNISIGENEIKSYRDFLNNPFDFMVELYWERYNSFYPPNSNIKDVFVRNSKVTRSEVDGLKELFEKQIKEMQHHAPKINKKVVSGIKKDSFNKYLNDNKKAEYDAVKKFIDAANGLKEYGCTGGVHLMHFSNGRLRLKGLEVIPNYSQYQ